MWARRIARRVFVLAVFANLLIVSVVLASARLRLGALDWLTFTLEGGYAKTWLIAVVVQLCLYFADLYDSRSYADVRELSERHPGPVPHGDQQTADCGRIGPRLGDEARHDVEVPIALEDARDGAAADRQVDHVLHVADVDAVPCHGVAVDADAELRLVAWNRRYASLFDYPAELLQVGGDPLDVQQREAEKKIGTGSRGVGKSGVVCSILWITERERLFFEDCANAFEEKTVIAGVIDKVGRSAAEHSAADLADLVRRIQVQLPVLEHHGFLDPFGRHINCRVGGHRSRFGKGIPGRDNEERGSEQRSERFQGKPFP